MSEGFAAYAEAFSAGFKLEPDFSVWEWADLHRVLTSKSSAEATRWRTDRTPYLREIMERLSARDPVQRIVFMKGSRVGGTEAANNWIGYLIANAPGPVLVVQPSLDAARSFSQQFLEPMIDTTEEVRTRVAERGARSTRNRTLYKEFVGGSIRLVGAKSPRGFRQVLARYILEDDADGFPSTVDEEGDPVTLAEMRAATFGARRKVFIVSTPTVKGDSRIEKEWLRSDQRRFFVPCPHCGHRDWLRWDNLKYSHDDPETALLMCSGCGALIDEGHKTAMLAAGEWRATDPGPGKPAGYHLSGLYSPLGWFSWADCVRLWLKAKDDPSELRGFINTVLGETWDENPDTVEPETLLARREIYAAEVPDGVGILVVAVDTQDDRLEWHVMGYGVGEESWAIDHGTIPGDPGTQAPWRELDRVREFTYRHASGRDVPIEIMVVDAGGHHFDEVLAYCKPRLARRVFAIRGGSVSGNELVGKASSKNKARARLYTLGVDSGKDTVYSRLRIPKPNKTPPSPGFIHLPSEIAGAKATWCDREYVAQLTSEVRVRKHVRGRGWTREWKNIRDRNEIWDLHVYSLAALRILGAPVVRNLELRAKHLSSAPPAGVKPAAPGSRARAIAPATPQRRAPTEDAARLRRLTRGGFISRRRWPR